MVDLCFLGTLGGMPMVDRYMSATLINFNGRKILIDCGEGTQIAMRKVGWGFKSIDVICISHSHGDHTMGLPGLLATMGNSGREEEVTIIGPKGIKRVVDGLNVVNPYLPYPLKIVECSGECINLFGDIELSTLELDHSADCLGYSFYFKRNPKFSIESAEANKVPRVLWSKLQKGNEVDYEGIRYTPNMVLGEERSGIKLSFITDTRPIKEIPRFISKSDLFICEGTYGSDEDIDKAIKNKHMTFREAGTLAKDGKVKELILTHFSPAVGEPEAFINNAKDIMENSSIAHDGLVKTLNYVD